MALAPISSASAGADQQENAIGKVIDMMNWACSGNTQYQELCALVTLDMGNTFNSALWKHVDTALRTREVQKYLVNIQKFYMSNRELVV